MSSQKQLPQLTVQKYLNDDNFSHLPNLTLAKLLFKNEHPLFNYVEHARTTIRRARGNSGNAGTKGATHQSSNHSENNLDGNVVTTWSTGCLCELNPSYLPINKWNHGFAFVTIDETGTFYVDNMKIIDGKIS